MIHFRIHEWLLGYVSSAPCSCCTNATTIDCDVAHFDRQTESANVSSMTEDNVWCAAVDSWKDTSSTFQMSQCTMQGTLQQLVSLPFARRPHLQPRSEHSRNLRRITLVLRTCLRQRKEDNALILEHHSIDCTMPRVRGTQTLSIPGRTPARLSRCHNVQCNAYYSNWSHYHLRGACICNHDLNMARTCVELH